MNRRRFLTLTSAAAVTLTLDKTTLGELTNHKEKVDAAWYRRSRKFADLPSARVAYVEHGRGPAALFLHGLPLNGYQWRGALERLHPHRRCIAPDFMSMGYTEARERQQINPDTQAEMLAALLDALRLSAVDLVANDSGGMVAQVFVAKYPKRVRTLLLTNCDVDKNNPPENFVPAVEMAKRGEFTKKFLVPQARDKNLARTAKGMLGSVFTYPDRIEDETLDIYLQPLVSSENRMKQLDEYIVSLGVNELAGLRERLRSWGGRARMVWALKDTFFPVEWADWLDKNLAHSTGVRRLEQANLFFPEEMPDAVAEEAKRLWGVR
jgi:haloalkane dehalogenase